MRVRTWMLAAAVATTVLGGCGSNSCPTEPAAVDKTANPVCTGGAAQPVSVQLELCADCSKTSGSCQVDLSQVSPGGGGSIHLDTTWEACADNSSCATRQCSGVMCTFTVPAGTYTVYANDVNGLTQFPLDLSGAGPTCGTWI